MKKGVLCVALTLALALSGCTSMLNRDYLVVGDHVEHTPAPDGAAVRVDTYQGLVTTLGTFVRQGRDKGVLRLPTTYMGNVSDDVDRACQQLKQEDPMGAYAVTSVVQETSRIISYYEVSLTFRYRVNDETIRGIKTVHSQADMVTAISNCLATFGQKLVLECTDFLGDEHTVRDLLEVAYYATPAAALGTPRTLVKLYGQGGSHQVVDLFFTYSTDIAALTRTKEQLVSAAGQLCGTVEQGTNRQLLELLHRHSRYDPTGKQTAAAALLEGAADSVGMALAYQLLCDLEGVNAVVVLGTFQGEDRAWVLVQEEGAYRHLLPALADFVLYNDDQLAQLGYDWNRTTTPPAPPTPENETNTQNALDKMP